MDIEIIATMKNGTRIFKDRSGDYFIQDRHYPRDVVKIPKRMMRVDLMKELVVIAGANPAKDT